MTEAAMLEKLMNSTVLEPKTRSRLIWAASIGGCVLGVVGLIIFPRMNHVSWDRIVNLILMIATVVIAFFAVIQARAATLTAVAAMSSQRAWILAEGIKAPNQIDIDYIKNEYRASPQLEFIFKVSGVTPIQITKCRIRLHFVQQKLDSPGEPDLPISPNYGGNSGFFQNSGIGRTHCPGFEFSIKMVMENASLSSAE